MGDNFVGVGHQYPKLSWARVSAVSALVYIKLMLVTLVPSENSVKTLYSTNKA